MSYKILDSEAEVCVELTDVTITDYTPLDWNPDTTKQFWDMVEQAFTEDEIAYLGDTPSWAFSADSYEEADQLEQKSMTFAEWVTDCKTWVAASCS